MPGIEATWHHKPLLYCGDPSSLDLARDVS